MSAGIGQRFATALQETEQTKDAEPVTSRFADNAY